MNPIAHVFHIILTLVFFPWGLVYLCCVVSAGNKRNRTDRDLLRRQTEALEEMNRVNKYRGYRE